MANKTTPVQQAIEWIDNERDRKAAFNDPVTAFDIQEYLESLLPTEEAFAKEVFEAGENHKLYIYITDKTTTDIKYPDFKTLYSQYNKQMTLSWILRKHRWGNYTLRGKNNRYRKKLKRLFKESKLFKP
jgi:hypothetical protein